MQLISPHSRNQLKQILLECYFSDSKENWRKLVDKTYFDQVAESILKESPANYEAEIIALKDSMDNDMFDEELFIRSAAFRKQITEVYSNTCCISGLRIESSDEISLIDACHIIPFSQSHNDTVSNGLALSPTLHRAFDRHLIGIDENYRVVVSPQLVELSDSPYSIKNFEGKHILLPSDKTHYPAQENLYNHLKLMV